MNRVKSAIAQWQREMPGLDLLPMEVVGYLKTSQLITRNQLEAFFKTHGLQAGEFDVLATLRRAGAPADADPAVRHPDGLVRGHDQPPGSPGAGGAYAPPTPRTVAAPWSR